jgi:hypothetical protein
VPGNPTDFWNGGVGGWNTGANWGLGVPTSEDDAVIMTGHPIVASSVLAEAAVVVVGAAVGSGEASPTLTVSGTLTAAEFVISEGCFRVFSECQN